MKLATLPSSHTETSDSSLQPWRSGQEASLSIVHDEAALTERYLPLVRVAVDRMKVSLPAHVDADDLHSVGVIGLLSAIQKFDPMQEKTFGAYATFRIRGAILDELRRLDWCPRRVRVRARKLQEATDTLEQTLGRAATETEVAQALGIGVRELEAHRDEIRPATLVALDFTNDDSEQAAHSLHETLKDDQAPIGSEELQKKEMAEVLAQRIAQLPERQRKILGMYYYEDMRICEIAAVMNVTESRICQIHAKVIEELRTYLQQVK